MKKRLGFVLLLLAVLFAQLPSESLSLEEIKKKVVEIGRLPFIRPVPVRYMKRDELAAYLTQLFDTEYPADQAKKEADFGVMMGFFEQDLSLKDLRKKLLLDNLGGLYNEKTKELVALEEFRSIDMFNVLALVHELRHALQDQHFPISGMVGKYSDYDDRSLAALAALEGDATLVMVEFMGIDPEMIANALQPETIFSFASVPGVSALIQAPDLIKYQMLMPYLDGLKFSSHIMKGKKWHAVNQVLGDPPQSSEQILHPQKYISRESPLPVQIRLQPRDWELQISGVLGEYFLNVLLKPADAIPDLAAGWGGDEFRLYRKSASRLLIWKSLWDTEADGARFYSDFRRFIERKFKVELKPGSEGGRSFLAGRSDFGYFLLHREKQKLLYIRTDDRSEINALISGGLYD